MWYEWIQIFYRFSVEETKHLLVLCFSIPASLWIFSCSCLFGCSKTLRVEENGQMRIKCRKRLDDAEGLYRSSCGMGKDISGNNIGQKNKYKKNGGKISWKYCNTYIFINRKTTNISTKYFTSDLTDSGLR